MEGKLWFASFLLETQREEVNRQGSLIGMQTKIGESTCHEVAGRQGLLKAQLQVDDPIDGGPRD